MRYYKATEIILNSGYISTQDQDQPMHEAEAALKNTVTDYEDGENDSESICVPQSSDQTIELSQSTNVDIIGDIEIDRSSPTLQFNGPDPDSSSEVIPGQSSTNNSDSLSGSTPDSAIKDISDIIGNNSSFSAPQGEDQIQTEVTNESLAENYMQCIGKLKFAAEKLHSATLIQSGVLHFESSFSKILEVCSAVTLAIQESKVLALENLNIVQSLPDDVLGCDRLVDKSPLIENDPSYRPERLTKGQIKYLISNGPCQPILSVYEKDFAMQSKGKQCSFSPAWFKEYPYLEYSISSSKAYCFVCSLFGKGGFKRENS